MTPEVLTPWGLLINRRLKALVCLTCQAVIPPAQVPGHISRQHKDARIRVDREKLRQIVEAEGILPDMPDISAANQVEYEGLVRAWGFSCPSCPSMFQWAKNVVTHCRRVHDLEVAVGDVGNDWMQRLSQAQHANSWFRVIPRSAQLHSPSADYLRSVREDLDTRPSLPAADLDHRHISPWHATTRWLQYTEGKDPRRMQALIEPPKEGEEYFFLIACVRNYVQAAYDLIPQTSEVCLQILHTDTRTE